MLTNRVRFKPLQDKITDPATAASHIQDGTNLFISGLTAGYPKLIPQELVKRAETGEQFKINLFAGASTGDSGRDLSQRRPRSLATTLHERQDHAGKNHPGKNHPPAGGNFQLSGSDPPPGGDLHQHGHRNRHLRPGELDPGHGHATHERYRRVGGLYPQRGAHPDFRDQLWDYYQRAVRERGGHEPHTLEQAFFMHRLFMENGDMRVR